MRSLILIKISSIILYIFRNNNLLKDEKTLKINEILNSYKNFLYYLIYIPH